MLRRLCTRPCSKPPILVALPASASRAVIAGQEHQVAANHLWRQHQGREDTRPGSPQGRPGKQPVRSTAPRPRHGPSAWKVIPNPAQPSPTIAQCLNGGLAWLEMEGNRCRTRASLPLDAIRRRRDTPLWKLEASLKCRSCGKGLRPTWHSYCRWTRRSGSRRILFSGSLKGSGQFSDIL